MLGEGDQKRQATVGNVINVKGMRTINTLGGIFANYSWEFVAETHLFLCAIFFSLPCRRVTEDVRFCFLCVS